MGVYSTPACTTLHWRRHSRCTKELDRLHVRSSPADIFCRTPVSAPDSSRHNDFPVARLEESPLAREALSAAPRSWAQTALHSTRHSRLAALTKTGPCLPTPIASTWHHILP